MNISTIFFDLDDTLYPASSGLWAVIRQRIGMYMHSRLNIPADEASALQVSLFQQYGTALRGLQARYDVDTAEYLAFVHDVPLQQYISPDVVLQQTLAGLPARKFIFTNGDIQHARRVLQVLQIEQYFDGIIDITAITPYCKPMPQSFDIALNLAGETDPRRCVLIDDLPRTISAARQLGMFSILFGSSPAQADADATLLDWASLPGLLDGRNHEHG